MQLDGFFIGDEQFGALSELCKELHGGSEEMRECGAALWLILHGIAEQRIAVPFEYVQIDETKLN